MKHPLNGKRASAWDQKNALCVIAKIPFNPPFPPLDMDPSRPMVRAMIQITLHPGKITEMGLLRLGETPGDEANCWIDPQDILIIEVLGRVAVKDGKLEVNDALERADIRAAA